MLEKQIQAALVGETITKKDGTTTADMFVFNPEEFQITEEAGSTQRKKNIHVA